MNTLEKEAQQLKTASGVSCQKVSVKWIVDPVGNVVRGGTGLTGICIIRIECKGTYCNPIRTGLR